MKVRHWTGTCTHNRVAPSQHRAGQIVETTGAACTDTAADKAACRRIRPG